MKRIETQAVSSVYGKIKVLLLIFPVDFKEITPALLKLRFGGIFEAFGDRVTFVVMGRLKESTTSGEIKIEKGKFEGDFHEAMYDSHLCKDHHIIQLDAPVARKREKGLPPPDKNNGSWVQDYFCVLQTEREEMVLLEPFFSRSASNDLVAEQIASATGALLKPSLYFLEGGNILVGDDYALIGRNTLEANIQKLFAGKPREEAESEITSGFKRLLGVKYIVWVGFDEPKMNTLKYGDPHEGYQPFFHLDLFLSLGGLNDKGNEIVFIAELDEDAVIGAGKEKFSKEISALKNDLSGIKKSLMKFHESHPGPRFEVFGLKMGMKINEDGTTVIYSYNNGLVENFSGIRRYYLPWYKDMELGEYNPQALNEQALRMNGFTPVVVKGFFSDYAAQHGSLNCMTKVLSRKLF